MEPLNTEFLAVILLASFSVVDLFKRGFLRVRELRRSVRAKALSQSLK